MFVKTATWEIFCFECNKEIYVDSHKKLYEAVEFIKKTNTKPNKSTAPKVDIFYETEAKIFIYEL